MTERGSQVDLLVVPNGSYENKAGQVIVRNNDGDILGIFEELDVLVSAASKA